VLPFSIDPIREFLAGELKLSIDQIKLIDWQPVTWRDGCLGVHKSGEGCIDLIIPGFTLKFQTGSTTSVVNTDATGKNYRLAQTVETPGPLPALSWLRTGGIAGICQNLNVYSTGNYLFWDCKADKLLSQGVMPEANSTTLTGPFEKYSSFVWKSMPPAGSADMFIDEIRFYGTGSQAITADEQQKLDTLLATVASSLATSSGTSGGSNESSGITGQVLIGPTCGGPVGPTSTECADKPYATTITVLDLSGNVLETFATDAEGRFRIPLQPGVYILHPESTGKLPAAFDQQINVVSGQFISVTITYDSGLR
jgi:hypothetical protein